MLSDIKCQGCFNMQNNCIQSLTNSGCMWKLSNCLVPTNWRLYRVLSNDIDLLNPKPDLEKRRHKLKRLVQSQTPSSCLPACQRNCFPFICDGTFFPSLHDEMSAIVGCFNRRAQNLLQVHLSSGFRKYFTWIKRKLVKGNHVAMVEEGKKGLLHIFAGYAVGGGHVLHMVCDLTIAADNAVFGQTGPKVGSLDAGYGSSIMSRLISAVTATFLLQEGWQQSTSSAIQAEGMSRFTAV
ncbi:hypothetical protein C5167_027399 [Papaver somniferum]|nr:hypothetical protein C5167_027399 [Papaver somniferum]